MNAVMREVRLLDRKPGEPAKETKIVEGIRIDKNIPIPEKKIYPARIDAALAALEVGESFEHTKRTKSRPEKHAGKKFTQRKLGPDRYRIWRVK